MKKFILVIAILVAGYYFWQEVLHNKQIEPLYQEPYVVVYGRDQCGWTHKYIKDLKDEGIDVIYEIVDSDEVCDELHPRMEEAGLDTKHYLLPVIDVNGHMYIRPDLALLLEAYEDYE